MKYILNMEQIESFMNMIWNLLWKNFIFGSNVHFMWLVDEQRCRIF